MSSSIKTGISQYLFHSLVMRIKLNMKSWASAWHIADTKKNGNIIITIIIMGYLRTQQDDRKTLEVLGRKALNKNSVYSQAYGFSCSCAVVSQLLWSEIFTQKLIHSFIAFCFFFLIPFAFLFLCALCFLAQPLLVWDRLALRHSLYLG